MLKIESIEGKYFINPTKSYIGDAGWDVLSLERKVLQPGEIYKFLLGFRIIGEPGKYYRTEDRSSMALKGLKVVGPVIDNGYRGEVSIILANTLSLGEIEINYGDKIGQILIHNVEDDSTLIINKKLQYSELKNREDHGYGSSGK